MKTMPGNTIQLWRKRTQLATFALLATFTTLTVAQPQDASDPFDLSLDELLEVEVTSVSKRTQSIMDSAAAVFVISSEDIRRSGATSIPEALRLAPGITVAQIDASSWAIGTRGFTGRFANKLLVLLDGRVIYSPVFTGVFWDLQDTPLDDIDRIEVIRGPGATLWGANAVNGVINILTKSSGDTHGGLLHVHAGNQEHGLDALRFGGSLGANGDYRVYARTSNRDSNRFEESLPLHDHYAHQALGFRSDLTPTTADSIQLAGELYRGDSDQTVEVVRRTPPYRPIQDVELEHSGFNLRAAWNRILGDKDQLSAQVYFDRVDREWVFSDLDQEIVDFYADYQSRRIEGHDLIAGVGYRLLSSSMAPSERNDPDPIYREEEIINLFIQDEISLVPERLKLIVGSKFELNDFTGWEVQPNVRLLWTPDPRYSIWAAVSRAARTPSRSDRDYRILYTVFEPDNPAALPVFLYAQANKEFQAEYLTAWEAGIKMQPTPTFSLELAAYYSDYEDLRALATQNTYCEPVGSFPLCVADPTSTNLAVDTLQENGATARVKGLELNGAWYPYPELRLQLNYNFLDSETAVPDGAIDIATFSGDPRHQASLRASYDPFARLSLDLWVRYVDEITNFELSTIDAYTNVDARIAWHQTPNIEIALVGKSLFDSARPQFLSEFNDIPLVEIERSIFLQLKVEF